ncbi:hypothetical protein JYU34_004409 [Plutella xylostella]|uniref:FLYWCH-type domain-containing protein n=1 Tax=Plutella xylostella TaxID=51655 RepID=A0ABQ7QXW9_PLUXY|nr:hypothetical protein JYU34_004409 [Plutella xylostella]
MTKRNRPRLVVSGFSFFKKRAGVMRDHWECSTHHSKGCRAYVCTVNDEIIKMHNQHTHGCGSVREIRLKSGKTLLMKSYYTYHRNRKTPDGTRYLCSMRGCACWLVMTEDLQVVRSSEQHAHDPPKFYVYNGIYFRIKK